MRSSPTRLILADTGFWYAAFDQRDENHASAISILDTVGPIPFLFPWPLCYEVLRTRFVKRQAFIQGFLHLRKAERLFDVDDTPYRTRALEAALDFSRIGKRPISLVDMVIRLVIDDGRFRIGEVITYNKGDFHDVCRSRRIPMRPT